MSDGVNGEDDRRLDTTRAWWQRLVEFAALVALPPTLAYALGVMALWVQISTAYDSTDAWTNWQAATVATKPFVAGLGVGVLLRALAFALLGGGALFAGWWMFVRFGRKTTPFPLSGVVALTCLSVGLILGVLGGFSNDTVPLVPNLRTIGVPVALYLMLLCWPLLSGPEQRSFFGRVLAFYPRALYAGVALMAVALVVSFALFPGELRLACLTRQVVTPTEERLGVERTEGRLVAHADGHWWVFDAEGTFAAIPDGEERMLVEEASGDLPSREGSKYSGLYREAPYNPISLCD